MNLGLLAALVDDAGLFPPEELPMPAALARHRADEAAGHPMLTHRLLCPASRLAELRAELASAEPLDSGGAQVAANVQTSSAGQGGRPVLRLGVILDTGLDGFAAARAEVAAEPELALEGVEVPAPTAEAVTAVLDAVDGAGTAVFVEGPRDPGWIGQLAGRGGPGGLRGAKVRCGGARAELFPSPDELAGFVCACFGHGVPFKATAGLHRAVRHLDERTGFVHHGFLNLLVAAVRAAAGADVGEVASALASTDGPALAGEARAASGRAVVAARSLFRGYGSCSTSEPRGEAAALGLSPDPAPGRPFEVRPAGAAGA